MKKTIEFLKERGVTREWEAVTADEDAEYARVLDIKLDELVPVVAYPHLPENTHPAKEGHAIKIDQVVIGSCTNGRLEDLEQAAEILKGHKVCDHVRMIIIPATQQIYQEAMHRGYIDTFIDAGAAVSTPTCGPCLGGYMGILQQANELFPPPTVTSAAAWVMSTAKFIWQAPIPLQPVPLPVISPA